MCLIRKPDVEKMIQTKGLVIMQETEMMVDRCPDQRRIPFFRSVQDN